MQSPVNISIITPEQYTKRDCLAIQYGFAQTQFGSCIIGILDDHLCYLAFYESDDEHSAVKNLQNEWPNALLSENNDLILPFVAKIYENNKEPLKVLLRGTEFQTNVWQELVKIKPGSTSSYQNIAQTIGKPSAIRAVASVIARNRVAYVIPCHRVIQKSGKLSKYRWGVDRKKQILMQENALV